MEDYSLLHLQLTARLFLCRFLSVASLLPENLRKSKAVNWALLSQVYGKGVLEDED